MLPLKDAERVRILAAVAKRGGAVYEARRLASVTASLALLAAVPALGIVRIDAWDGRHLLLGSRVDAVSAIKGFIVAMAALYGFTFLTNVVVGRFFCGWGCPVGHTSRLGEAVALKPARSWVRVRSHVAGAAFVAAFAAAILGWWVDPAVLWEGSPKARLVLAAVFAALTAGGWLHAFRWRFAFCKSACPIGVYYRFVTSRAPVGIQFREDDPCLHCSSCERVCPVQLDPKALATPLPPKPGTAYAGAPPALYGDAECLRCGDCVEACRMMFAKRPDERPPLRFGRSPRTTGVKDTAAPRR